jgi:branched-chain amino acid transport system ATP-binding protein
MLAIARALMSKPSLLMLDEPSVGLAPAAVSATYEVLARIRESGTTMLLVEQQVHRALEFADRAYLLQTGVVVGEGPCAQLKDSEEVRKAYLGM